MPKSRTLTKTALTRLIDAGFEIRMGRYTDSDLYWVQAGNHMAKNINQSDAVRLLAETLLGKKENCKCASA